MTTNNIFEKPKYPFIAKIGERATYLNAVDIKIPCRVVDIIDDKSTLVEINGGEFPIFNSRLENVWW